MFEQDRQQVLAELRRKMAGGSAVPAVPVPAISAVSAGSTAPAPDRQVLAVPEPLAEILPYGGLPRGSVVGLGHGGLGHGGLGHGGLGHGGLGRTGGVTSLLFTLLAAPANAWSAVVGMPDIGLLAAAEMGVDLDRIVLIPDPGPDVLQVMSVLADGVDIIAVVPPKVLAPARLRVLSARLRQSGAVLLVAGQWPGADLVLESRIEGWTGLGRGHGRLRDRRLIVEVNGRGAAGRHRSAEILLHSSRSRVDVGSVPVRVGHQLDPLVAEVG